MRLFGCVAILCGVIGGMIGQSSFPHTLLLVAIGGYIVAPFLGVCGMVAVLCIVRRAIQPWLLPTFIALLWVISALLASHAVGSAVYRWQEQRVMTYVPTAQEILDKIKTVNGAYPPSLPSDLAGKLPAWLKEPNSYRSDGQTFTFSYHDPRAMMFGSWTYYSIAKRWQYDD